MSTVVRKSSLDRDLPLPHHLQIHPIRTVCEKLTKNLGRALPPTFGQNPKEQQFFRETIPLKIEQRECSALRNMIKMMMTVISMIEAPSLGWNCLSVMESVPSPRLELALPSFQLISSPLLLTSLVSLTN